MTLNKEDIDSFLDLNESLIKNNEKINNNFKDMEIDNIIDDIVFYKYNIGNIKKVFDRMNDIIEDMEKTKLEIDNRWKKYQVREEELILKVKQIKNLNAIITRYKTKEKLLDKKIKSIIKPF